MRLLTECSDCSASVQAGRQSATGEWSQSSLQRRADVAVVSPTVRRFRVKPLPDPHHAYEADFAYRKAADGGPQPAVVDAHLAFEQQATSAHCVVDGATLHRVHASPAGGPGGALIP